MRKIIIVERFLISVASAIMCVTVTRVPLRIAWLLICVTFSYMFFDLLSKTLDSIMSNHRPPVNNGFPMMPEDITNENQS